MMGVMDDPAPTRPSSAKAAQDGRQLAYEGLDELLGFHLRRAQGAVHRSFLAALGAIEMTQKQTATLWLIGANPGVSQIQVAGELDMDRATMMAIVDKLCERGWLLRRRSETDRRRQELYLTPRGQAALKKAKARIAEHERRIKSAFSEEELRLLSEALRRLY